MPPEPMRLDAATSTVEVEPTLASTPAIGEAIQELPRRDFVGFSGGIGRDRWAEVPLTRTPTTSVIAAMLGGLQLTPGDRAYQIGTGTGYPAALLAKLTDRVDTIDVRADRIDTARSLYRMIGFDNVSFHIGDGLRTTRESAPFDAILVSTLTDRVPDRITDQLAPDGRAVVPVRKNGRKASLLRLKRAEGELHRQLLGTVDFASRLGDLLVDFSLLPRFRIEQVAQRARKGGEKLGERLLREGMIDEETLYHVLSLQHGMSTGSVRALLHGATQEFFNRLPERYMRHNEIVPIKVVAESVLVATTNPKASMNELRAVLDFEKVEPYLVTPTAFHRIWDALESGRIAQGIAEASEPSVEAPSEASTEPSSSPPPMMPSQASVDNEYVRLFESILFDAAAERASDIHLERYGDDVRLRFRIDGELRDVDRYELSPTEYRGLINVIKIAANLDIAERRLPQGGRLEKRIEGETIDLRVQMQPALEDEFCVIRLLPQDRDLLTVDDLGFPPDVAEEYERIVRSPNGLILVVGPTGSGKSTTLYAGLQILARNDKKKIITVEDPVEYAIDGIEQTQVHPKIGFSFADAMRSFVRQDPDVIMVGEIRDDETALEAIRASQTGHVVLSTLHCNDSVDAVQRLFDLGMQPNSIASELIGVFAQRLARRICRNCRASATPEPEILEELFPDGAPDDFECFVGRGCTRCDGAGTRGRIAVVEALPVGPEIRRAIAQQLPLDDLRQRAVDAGLDRLRRHALDLVRRGVIPLVEIPRILSVEAMAPTGPDGAQP